MITLHLDWREVLWWMQGGMAGSHLRWNVYEDMVNRVWPQASEQERRNMFLIMRRDLGTYWRPDGWNGHSHMTEKGEGPWKESVMEGYGFADGRGFFSISISDRTPWTYFRHVLARFDPDNQFAVTMRCKDSEALDSMLRFTPDATIISKPSTCHLRKNEKWESDTATITVRAYKWQDKYYIDWDRYCDKEKIMKIEQLDIPDEETM